VNGDPVPRTVAADATAVALDVESSSFGINAFWVGVSVLNFALFVGIVYAIVRFARSLRAGRRREQAELADLRDRAASLETGADRRPPTN